ncbi:MULTISPECIES: GGDEF domain-containing protein [unclassified Oceanispirochaeta]|uniref:GGDEF domain-containing protein n=1 Tax=unclassified Oceanispirochaeta TaxID=2635722 RepID=UPI000E08DAA4|nr:MULTISPECIES: GGDEF domain-containing protein [unclassified Oceanispirochaeta]MBF9016864.1 GGDEF domain-containing protein [Oceanispirochaeta sp. M2]NPD73227.1 GGDEF domain-containing protein [Oceanispirochaeta sp. M1]RDG31093.1 GGDEF domain-containing protein [Oceanispirochaeta sp. M1]
MADKLLPLKSELLKKTDMFSSLLDHELEVIADHSEFRTYRKGDSVFKIDEPGDALYIVRSGEVLISKQEPYGPVIDIARFIDGNCFGEIDMFTESDRGVSAHATGNTELLIFPKSGTSFADILNNHPEISARILHKLLAGISSRIRSANALVKENSPIIQELKKQVYRDKLTGIYNDTYLLERVRKNISIGLSFALIISKPDNFKELNDEYGHEAGDIVIKLMARKLRDYTGDDKRTVRYKGNAMAVMLPDVDRDEAYNAAKGVQNFLKGLDISEVTKGKKFKLSASVGIALFPDHYTDPEELVFKTHELPLIGRNRGGNCILFPEDGAE